ncbi:50S ribosomal protein L21 [Candidatus Saganbacteria bacterium CG08_land_8_20_14_0_20_45_16]|uniref:Large ribosomal subunit protein bL21 n=1 Tax=Candidatus Saganbacteria bacterium CG08_land_8_20_14_0_20_45_16 TaxID=2014293 RepID=A0A2H0XZA1_UNCSA|nr:MAG: 50S ribosomal protein L21 [Candidatus Saganbacteria bacterium CG08_land_8_20_14_0_20_45_16]
MYAIIETGSKQYKVSPGEVLEVELLDAKDTVTFDKVLLVADGEKLAIGTPFVKGAKVEAKVLGTGQDDKVTSFKYKNKTNYHRTIGHRQRFIKLEITGVTNGA